MKRLLIIAFVFVTGVALAQRPASKASSAPKVEAAPAGLASDTPAPAVAHSAGQAVRKDVKFPSAQMPEVSITSSSAAVTATTVKLSSEQMPGAIEAPKAPEGK